MATNPDFIHCMLIPLKDHFLLLPNPTIAEVIPMPKIEPIASAPDYWLGHYQWRENTLPVVDIESLIENKTNAVDTANKLCILNGINSEADIEFYALPCFGAPQLIMLNETAIQQTHDADDSDFLYCQIKIGNKVAFIPHLDNIEANIKEQT